jgi:hypothetical protein
MVCYSYDYWVLGFWLLSDIPDRTTQFSETGSILELSRSLRNPVILGGSSLYCDHHHKIKVLVDLNVQSN